jgi:hypothetical protein
MNDGVTRRHDMLRCGAAEEDNKCPKPATDG